MGSDLTRTQHRSRAGNPTCHSHTSEQQGKETNWGKLTQKIFGICKGYKNYVLLPFHSARNTSWIPLMVGRALPDPGVTPAGKPGNCRNFLARKTAAGEGTAGVRGCSSQWLFVLFFKAKPSQDCPIQSHFCHPFNLSCCISPQIFQRGSQGFCQAAKSTSCSKLTKKTSLKYLLGPHSRQRSLCKFQRLISHPLKNKY